MHLACLCKYSHLVPYRELRSSIRIHLHPSRVTAAVNSAQAHALLAVSKDVSHRTIQLERFFGSKADRSCVYNPGSLLVLG